jgi:hypothetical protein
MRSLSFNAKATSPFQELTYILQRLVIKWQHFHNHEDLKQQIWKLTETHISLNAMYVFMLIQKENQEKNSKM